MKYLTKHLTEAAYEAAKDNLAKPHVALTADDNKVHYMPNTTPPTPQYRWTNSGTTCDGCYKYNNQVYEVSNDNGKTWQIVTPVQTQRGTLIEYRSVDCGWASPISITNVSEELPTSNTTLTITLSRPLSESEMCCNYPTIKRLYVELKYYESTIYEEESNPTYVIEYFDFDEDADCWIAKCSWSYDYYDYNYEKEEYEYSHTDDREISLRIDRWEGESSSFMIIDDEMSGYCEINNIVMDV